jgi:hypothetical protein
MKTCSKCGETKPISEFHFAGHCRSDGTKYVRGECKVCQKKVVKNRDKLIREQYVAWKKTLKCNHCGFDDYRALQFHHEGDKENNISSMLTSGHSLENIQKEASKCVVLCANCHQIHHYRP